MAEDLQAQIASLLEAPAKVEAPPVPARVASSAGSPERSGSPSVDVSLESLRDIIDKNQTKVKDLFRAWDDDKNGKINKVEFRRALLALGFQAPKEAMGLLFDQLDRDASGTIDYNELHIALKDRAAKGADPKKMMVRKSASQNAEQLLATQRTLREEQAAREEGDARSQQAISLLQQQQVAFSESEAKLADAQHAAEQERERTERLQADLAEREAAEKHVREQATLAQQALQMQAEREAEAAAEAAEQTQKALQTKVSDVQETLAVAQAVGAKARVEADSLREQVDRLNDQLRDEASLREQQESLALAAAEANAELSRQTEALREGLANAERTIDKWERRAEQWAHADAERTKLLQSTERKLEETEGELSALKTEQAQQLQAWHEERTALGTRLAEHEHELERARQQQSMRDSLASAIMHTATNDHERGDSVHFWQSRKLRWKSVVGETEPADERATTAAAEHGEGQQQHQQHQQHQQQRRPQTAPEGARAADWRASLPPDNYAQLPWRRAASSDFHPSPFHFSSGAGQPPPLQAMAAAHPHQLPPQAPAPLPLPLPPSGSYSAHLLSPSTQFGVAPSPVSYAPPPPSQQRIPPFAQTPMAPVVQPSFVSTPGALRAASKM
jgi:hypothetical protein